MGLDAAGGTGRDGTECSRRVRSKVYLRPKLSGADANLRTGHVEIDELGEPMATSSLNQLSSSVQENVQRANILGVGVCAVNMESAVARIEGWIERKEPNYVIAVPAHCI